MFKAVTKGGGDGGSAVAEALEYCDAVVFTAGRAAYRVAGEAKRAGLYEKTRSQVARMKVAVAEGDKGAVMVLNALCVRPAATAAAVEELGGLPLRRCLPPRGERRGASGARRAQLRRAPPSGRTGRPGLRGQDTVL